jgi:hypothetical protein
LKDVVLDTNVMIVANCKSTHASLDCQLASIKRLEELRESNRICLDDSGFILIEYAKKLCFSGQPGAGDAFFKYVFDRQADPSFCESVHVTPLNKEGTSFSEFPRTADLEKFDSDDDKFVAVSLAHGNQPPIINAVDSDWWIFRSQLASLGVNVEFICPGEMPENS